MTDQAKIARDALIKTATAFAERARAIAESDLDTSGYSVAISLMTEAARALVLADRLTSTAAEPAPVPGSVGPISDRVQARLVELRAALGTRHIAPIGVADEARWIWLSLLEDTATDQAARDAVNHAVDAAARAILTAENIASMTPGDAVAMASDPMVHEGAERHVQRFAEDLPRVAHLKARRSGV